LTVGTLSAAILDPGARELRFVSCGHPAPYVCRAASAAPGGGAAPGGPIELHALVGRGNPLGTGAPATPRVHQRPFQAGDVVVWYTDGVIEAQDPAGAPFGDRRLQHLLKRLDRARLTPAHVHDLVQSAVAAHRAGHPRADDETVVVAQHARRSEVRAGGAASCPTTSTSASAASTAATSPRASSR
jgi:sigma-B regulation protein RsbU (phosphoserine phosphatase)